VDDGRWQNILDLFHTAVNLPAEQQEDAVRAACSEESVVGEVLRLLAHDREEAGLLDLPVTELARETLAGGAGDLTEGRQIGPYRTERVLGEGGMGTVLLATRADLGTKVAIKVLRDAWISPARRKRFALEQRTLARLNHPNIARLLDADTLETGAPYFVMEYVDGVPLDTYCAGRNLTAPEVLRLFKRVCEAVQYAHQNMVIHRDLKPSNILVAPDGTVKLLDFGIAKQINDMDMPVDRTRTGLRMLTPAYASPEQVTGEAAGVGGDVYSLGVILYQLLTGRLPYDASGRTPAEALDVILRSDPVKPSLVARRVRQREGRNRPQDSGGVLGWDDLDVLCLTAMHRDPAKRYGSVEALLRDIDRYLRAEPLEARPDKLGYRFGKFVRRNRMAVAAGACAAVLMIAISLYFAVRLAAERNTALSEAAKAQRIQAFMLNLFQGGDEEAGPAQDLRVLTLLDRGVQEAGALGRDPALQAELYETLGGIYHKLGQLDRAEQLLKRALERRRAVTQDDQALAGTLVALGLLRVDQARLDEGEKMVRDGLQLAERSLAPGHPHIASALDALGRVLEEKGDYDEAASVLERAVRIRSARESEDSLLAGSQYGLANVHFYAGRYKESELLNRRVLELNRRTFGPGHPKVAEALINLGAIQQDLGHYAEAERLHREALVINRSFYGENHFRTASNLTLVARALVFQKRLDEASALLRQAVAIQERVFGADHPRVASAVNELGNIAIQRGEYDEAKAAYGKMLAIYRAVHPGRHYLIGTALSNLGSAHMAAKENEQAEGLFQQAIEMFTATLAPDHINTAIARIKYGRALLRLRRYAKAKEQSLAGYEVLSKQAKPSIGYLNAARGDLAEIHAALGEQERAAAFREEMAAAQAK
jgi:serine/threonine-protein kinase